MKLKFTSILIGPALIAAATLASAQNQKASIDFRIPRFAQPAPQPSHDLNELTQTPPNI